MKTPKIWLAFWLLTCLTTFVKSEDEDEGGNEGEGSIENKKEAMNKAIATATMKRTASQDTTNLKEAWEAKRYFHPAVAAKMSVIRGLGETLKVTSLDYNHLGSLYGTKGPDTHDIFESQQYDEAKRVVEVIGTMSKTYGVAFLKWSEHAELGTYVAHEEVQPYRYSLYLVLFNKNGTTVPKE